MELVVETNSVLTCKDSGIFISAVCRYLIKATEQECDF